MSCSFRHLYTKTKISSKSTNFVHTLNIIKICTIIFYIHAYIYIYNSPADVLLSKNRCDLKKKYYFFLNLIYCAFLLCVNYTHTVVHYKISFVARVLPKTEKNINTYSVSECAFNTATASLVFFSNSPLPSKRFSNSAVSMASNNIPVTLPANLGTI